MNIERHSLAKEIPEYKDQIHNLKTTNAHFARLFDEYHEVDHAIIRMEDGIENVCDETLADNKKKRLQLKDELYNLLQQA